MKMKKILATASALVLCTASAFTTVQPFGTAPAAVVSAASTNFASQRRCTITDVRSFTTGKLNFTISRNYGLKLKTLNVLGVKTQTGEWFFPTGLQIMVEKNGTFTTLYNSYNWKAGYLDTANIDSSSITYGNLDFTEMKSALIKGRYLKLSIAPVRVNNNIMTFATKEYYSPVVYFDYYAKKVVPESEVYRR